MYFPRLYPDELLYSGIARCRVHLGISNHKTLLHMAFGDSKVAAITEKLCGLEVTTAAVSRAAALLRTIQSRRCRPLYGPGGGARCV